jgi:predicted nucleic acid-binding protein
MNKYLLDTNVVSELRKPRPHGAVTEWLKGLESGQSFLSAVTLGELQAGVDKTRHQYPLKAQAIERWSE